MFILGMCRLPCYYLCTKVSCVIIANFIMSDFKFRKPIFVHGADDEPQVESVGGVLCNISCEHHICAVMSRTACQQCAHRCVIYDDNPRKHAALSVR